MITFYCPACWREVPEKVEVCPHCAAEIQCLLDERDYVAKLIAALSHREPTTPIRAASILGRLKAGAAVVPLMRLLKGPSDVYIKAAAIEALGNIGGTDVREVLEEYSRHPSVIVQRSAQAALQRFLANAHLSIEV